MNARIHPKHQADALKGVLTEVGIVQNIVVSELTGHVLDGHLRISLALRDRQPTVPVTWVNVSEDEERLILATLDPISAAAAWDREKLDDLLHEVSTGSADVQQLLDDLAAKIGIIPPQDVDELWKGMPEFEQEDAMGYKTLLVHFEDEQDYHAFARLIDQNLTEKTRFIWYPEQQRENLLAYRCEDES
jgi:hypothetical protein